MVSSSTSKVEVQASSTIKETIVAQPETTKRTKERKLTMPTSEETSAAAKKPIKKRESSASSSTKSAENGAVSTSDNTNNSPAAKKAKVAGKGAAPPSAAASETETDTVEGYTPPLTLPLIQERILNLMKNIPTRQATAQLSPTETKTLESWCKQVRTTIRQFNLVLNFIRPATYQWAPDRSGHTNQSLSTLNNEISLAGSTLSSIISSDINRVLTPTLDKQLKQAQKVEKDNVKTETYTYVHVIDDVEMLQLHREQLCVEALDKRELLCVTMQKIHKCLSDFIKSDEGTTDSRMQMY